MNNTFTENEQLRRELRDFHGSGFFAWQFASASAATAWDTWHYDEEKYWGGFSREPIDFASYTLPDWAIGPFS